MNKLLIVLPILCGLIHAKPSPKMTSFGSGDYDYYGSGSGFGTYDYYGSGFGSGSGFGTYDYYGSGSGFDYYGTSGFGSGDYDYYGSGSGFDYYGTSRFGSGFGIYDYGTGSGSGF